LCGACPRARSALCDLEIGRKEGGLSAAGRLLECFAQSGARFVPKQQRNGGCSCAVQKMNRSMQRRGPRSFCSPLYANQDRRAPKKLPGSNPKNSSQIGSTPKIRHHHFVWHTHFVVSKLVRSPSHRGPLEIKLSERLRRVAATPFFVRAGARFAPLTPARDIPKLGISPRARCSVIGKDNRQETLII